MRKSKRNLGSDLAKVDAHVITQKEYEEIPELTDEWFEAADFYIGDQLIRRGRPRKDVKKQMIAFRLPPDLIAAIKSKGRGYNARVEKALRNAAEQGLL